MYFLRFGVVKVFRCVANVFKEVFSNCFGTFCGIGAEEGGEVVFWGLFWVVHLGCSGF